MEENIKPTMPGLNVFVMKFLMDRIEKGSGDMELAELLGALSAKYKIDPKDDKMLDLIPFMAIIDYSVAITTVLSEGDRQVSIKNWLEHSIFVDRKDG